MAHSILPPSSANMWEKCHGWVTLNAFVPEEEESEAARIGTQVHAIIEQLFRDADFIDPTATDEMMESARMFVQNVREVITGRDGDLRIEQSVQIPRIHKACFGTPDATFFDPVKRVLFIWDYKHGMSLVEVFDNEQLISYAAGLMDEYGEDIPIVFRIVQPRAFHRNGPIREWLTDGVSLRGAINLLANAAGKNLNGDGQCQTGEHCRYCKAHHVCEAAINAGYSLYEASASPVPLDMSAAAMGVYYATLTRAIKHLESLKAGFEAQIMGRIGNGEAIPGWSVQMGTGNRKWSLDASALFDMGDAIGINLRKPVEPISPAQAEKLGFDKATVAALTVKPETGLKLVQSNPSLIFTQE